MRQASRLRQIMAAKRKEKEKVYLTELAELQKTEEQFKQDPTVAKIKIEQMFGGNKGLDEIK